MRKIRVVIVGADREGHSIYHCFKLKPAVEIIAIVDVSGHGLVEEALQQNILVSTSIQDIMNLPNVDVVVETTKKLEIRAEIYKYKHPDTQVIEASGLDLLITLGKKKEQTEAELHSILNTINDAVLMVNIHGHITYVNGAFIDLTGISSADVLNKNIFEWCPDLPLARALNSVQPCNSIKSHIPGTDKELFINATPIMIRGELQGAVGIIRQMPDIIQLMEELQRSTNVIGGIYDKLGQINGLSDMYVSDVMPIDKMEQLLLRQALAKYGFSVEGKKRAARALNISLATLYNKLKKYQIS